MFGPHETATGTGTATVDASVGVLYSVGLCAGADAATITVRKGGSGGTVLCKLGAAAGVSVERHFYGGKAYNDLHITITGTTPTWDVEYGPME